VIQFFKKYLSIPGDEQQLIQRAKDEAKSNNCAASAATTDFMRLPFSKLEKDILPS
jgi:hypothetical protein